MASATQNEYKVVKKVCPKCNNQLAYFTGVTIVRETITDSTADSEVRRHYRCTDGTCRHQWYSQ